MCIAIVTKQGARLTPEQIAAGWRSNRDGAGVAYVKEGKVVIDKGYLQLDKFQDAYARLADQFSDESPFLVHMRIGTSGHKDSPNNTHPFEVKTQRGPRGAMIHNGVLFTPTGDWVGPSNDRKSDTRVVCEALGNILQLEDVLRAKERISRVIGTGNKFAFLYDDKTTVILNEDQGVWKDNIWFSNSWSCRV